MFYCYNDIYTMQGIGKDHQPVPRQEIINFPGDVCREKNTKEGKYEKDERVYEELERKQWVSGKVIVVIVL